jgi:hypothetical protein
MRADAKPSRRSIIGVLGAFAERSASRPSWNTWNATLGP